MIWINPKQIELNKEIALNFKNSVILPHELTKRNMNTMAVCKSYLEPFSFEQTSPFSFPDMKKAIERITEAIKNNETIGIWGDFDVDGQTSTSVLIDGLTRMRANVIFHIPIRAEESHGIQINALKLFLKRKPSLILTCDTGISDHNAIEFAQLAGVDVIITDHHSLPETLPKAYAIINPHQLPVNHPLSYLSGVGTAFQVIRALNTIEMNRINIDNLYDLVALGTIADMSVLKSENRFYVQMGLEQMNQNLRTALKAMLTVSQINKPLITENTIGFNFAPRLNAPGRLSNANENVNFLLSDEKEYCINFAQELEKLNHTRKIAVEAVLQTAQDMIKRDPSLIKESLVILQRHRWEKGVLGIAASKLVEIYNRPVILLSIEDDKANGSARSVKGIDISATIRENEKYLLRHGGHQMAAGLSLLVDNLLDFSLNIARSLKDKVGNNQIENNLHIDHFISFSNIEGALIDELKQLSPFGLGNPPPIFASRNLRIDKIKQLGNTDKHVHLILRDMNGKIQKAIKWNSKVFSIPFERIDIAYHIQPDDYRGKTTYYLEYIDLRESVPNTIHIDALTYQIKFEDYRSNSDDLRPFNEVIDQSEDIQIWFEGIIKPRGIKIKNRTELQINDQLIILTAPPNYSVLNEILESSQAKKVYLFDIQLNPDKLITFLTSLGGLIKHCLATKITEIDLKSFASQLCQTENTIILGLSWFDAHGDINLSYDKLGSANISGGSNPSMDELPNIEQKIINSLKETMSFRSYYQRANPEMLFLKRGN